MKQVKHRNSRLLRVNQLRIQCSNEAPRSKLRGIKAEFAEANPPSLFKLRRVRPAIHPCSKLQGILAKANKPITAWGGLASIVARLLQVLNFCSYNETHLRRALFHNLAD